MKKVKGVVHNSSYIRNGHKEEVKGVIHHNSSYIRNEHKEKVVSLFGKSQSSYMDMYDFTFDGEERLIQIIKKQSDR